MFKQFILKQAIKAQLKGVPEEQKQLILAAVEKNPDMFIKLAEEAQAKVKGGMPQADAVASVLSEHGEEMRKLLSQ